MLEYDNSAFYYFALTLLIIYIIPGTWYAVSEFLRAFVGTGEIGAQARTKLEKEKAAKLKMETTGFTRLNTVPYITNFVILCISWIIMLYLVALVANDGEVSRFDPYQILGIAQGAAGNEIKKAYRKLSLVYHPDKNPGDKAAEEMFMKVAKAYEALTDETSKENYEKFGNPDGKQALEVSIGLPSIILDNPKVVLVLYLIAMVVVIPSVVGIWYANSKQYGEKNIKYETYNAFYTLLQEQHRIKNMPEVLAASAEYRTINKPKPEDNDPLGKLYTKMKNEKLMVKPKFEHAVVMRGNLLLHAHVLRLKELLNPELQKDLDLMLSRAPDLIDGIIEICHHRKWMDTSIAAIKFSQCLIQGLWTSNHSLEQLPYLTDAEVKLITKGAKPQIKSLGEYLKLADEDKKGLSELSAEEREEVLKVCNLIPNLTVKTELFVEEEEVDFLADLDEPEPKSNSDTNGDDKPKTGKAQAAALAHQKAIEAAAQITGDEIYEQDLVTLRITFTRENVTEGSKVSPVHAPFFPRTLKENWWIVLTDRPTASATNNRSSKSTEPNIHAFEKISEQGRTFVHELRFMAPSRAGLYEMDLQVFSDCYLGLDQAHTISFEVKPAAALPEYAPHPEDLELDNEPTLFEQVMAANVDDSSDDEDDDDDEEEEEEHANIKKGGPAGTKPKGVVVEDVDSEEED